MMSTMTTRNAIDIFVVVKGIIGDDQVRLEYVGEQNGARDNREIHLHGSILRTTVRT